MWTGGKAGSVLFVEEASLSWMQFMCTDAQPTGIDLAGQSLPDSTAQFIVDEVFPHLESLETSMQFNFSCCGLSLASCTALAIAMSGVEGSFHLDLSYNGLNDEAMFRLSRALSCAVGSCRSIDISGNAVGIDGLLALLDSSSLPHLRELTATDIKQAVCDGAVAALIGDALLTHSSLTLLQLSKDVDLSCQVERELVLTASNNINGCNPALLLVGPPCSEPQEEEEEEEEVVKAAPPIVKGTGRIVLHAPQQLVPPCVDRTTVDLVKENADLKKQLEEARAALAKKKKRKLKKPKSKTASRSNSGASSTTTTATTTTSTATAKSVSEKPRALQSKPVNSIPLTFLKVNQRPAVSVWH